MKTDKKSASYKFIDFLRRFLATPSKVTTADVAASFIEASQNEYDAKKIVDKDIQDRATLKELNGLLADLSLDESDPRCQAAIRAMPGFLKRYD